MHLKVNGESQKVPPLNKWRGRPATASNAQMPWYMQDSDAVSLEMADHSTTDVWRLLETAIWTTCANERRAGCSAVDGTIGRLSVYFRRKKEAKLGYTNE